MFLSGGCMESIEGKSRSSMVLVSHLLVSGVT